jgi:hypothetical protein
MNAASVGRRPRVSVIIPARNEAAKIRDALARLPHDGAELPRFVDALIAGAAPAKGAHLG